jgi:hypothetical protein
MPSLWCDPELTLTTAAAAFLRTQEVRRYLPIDRCNEVERANYLKTLRTRMRPSSMTGMPDRFAHCYRETLVSTSMKHVLLPFSFSPFNFNILSIAKYARARRTFLIEVETRVTLHRCLVPVIALCRCCAPTYIRRDHQCEPTLPAVHLY